MRYETKCVSAGSIIDDEREITKVEENPKTYEASKLLGYSTFNSKTSRKKIIAKVDHDFVNELIEFSSSPCTLHTKIKPVEIVPTHKFPY